MSDQFDEPLRSVAEGAPASFSFSVLGQQAADPGDADLEFQERRTAHFSARKACAMLKVTSAIVNAVVIHPGGDCDEQKLTDTTRELMRRAALLTDAAAELLDIDPNHQRFAGYKNLLRQQAAEVVATQWRMANGAGAKELSIEQISSMFKIVLKDGDLDKDGEMPPYPSDIDATTAKRISILGAIPEIYGAVNSFDYFTPDPEVLVSNGVQAVAKAADMGVLRIASPKAGPETITMLTQSLIGKAGALYAANYRAVARRDVLALQKMDAVERKRQIYIHRETGLPTQHVDESFARLMDRMVNMVCEAAPELKVEPEPEPATHADNSQMRGDHHDLKLE